jgi:hypothetical protein
MVKITVSSDREDMKSLLEPPGRVSYLPYWLSHTKVLVVAPTSLRESLALDHTDVFYTPDGESQKDVLRSY